MVVVLELVDLFWSLVACASLPRARATIYCCSCSEAFKSLCLLQKIGCVNRLDVGWFEQRVRSWQLFKHSWRICIIGYCLFSYTRVVSVFSGQLSPFGNALYSTYHGKCVNYAKRADHKGSVQDTDQRPKRLEEQVTIADGADYTVFEIAYGHPHCLGAAKCKRTDAEIAPQHAEPRAAKCSRRYNGVCRVPTKLND